MKEGKERKESRVFSGSVSKASDQSSKISAFLGARALVLGKFLEVAVPRSTDPQRNDIGREFSKGVDELVSLMDGMTLPTDYYQEFRRVSDSIVADLSNRVRSEQSAGRPERSYFTFDVTFDLSGGKAEVKRCT
jgi:hypothetical protein